MASGFDFENRNNIQRSFRGVACILCSGSAVGEQPPPASEGVGMPEPRPGGIALLQHPLQTPRVQNSQQAIFLAEPLTALRAGKACKVSQAMPFPKKR